MIEMRWLTREEEETIIPPVHNIQFGMPFDKHIVTKRKLQYRQQIGTTVRAMQWSEWKDVPEVLDGQ